MIMDNDIKAPIFAISRLRMGTDGSGIITPDTPLAHLPNLDSHIMYTLS
jgi:hypothetical protein